MHHPSIRPTWPRLAIAGTLALSPAFALATTAAASAGTPLTGTFTISAGACAAGVTGSYFRMILHSGTPRGPFLSNSDSTCSNHTYTLLSPGRDGGLINGRYQPQASPAFDRSGNALTDRITKPARFYGVNFATATNQVDPQTRTSVSPPQVTIRGTTLSADLRALGVSWNNQQFNQGSPKPNGSMPGNTRAVTGTYDATTGAYTMQWTSQIQGGPFDGFTGLWHLTGRFVPAGSTPTSQPSPTGSPRGGGATGGASSATTHPTSSGSPATRRSAFTSAAPKQSASSSGTPVPTTTESSMSTASSSGSVRVVGVDAGSGGGSTRWPWVLLAFLAVAGAGWGVVRATRTGRRT